MTQKSQVSAFSESHCFKTNLQLLTNEQKYTYEDTNGGKWSFHFVLEQTKNAFV